MKCLFVLAAIVRSMALSLLLFYQTCISPWLVNTNCRYYPSCSAYAVICFESLNIFDACILTSYRVLRCSPFGQGGKDCPPLIGPFSMLLKKFIK